MKNILILISLFVFSLNLNAQKAEKIKSKTFDDITVALYKIIESDNYAVQFKFPTSYNSFDRLWVSNKSDLFKLMNLILSADTRKGFHETIRWKENRNGKRFDEFTIMIRHAKKSDYIGIGKLHSFKYGKHGVLRTSAQSLYNYLNKLKTFL